MLALTIAFVVAFCIGLLIGLTYMNQKVKALESEKYIDCQIIDQLEAQVAYCYTPVFVRNRLAVYSEKWDWEQLSSQEQVTLKRQAARILGKKAKVTDEDHSISFP